GAVPSGTDAPLPTPCAPPRRRGAVGDGHRAPALARDTADRDGGDRTGNDDRSAPPACEGALRTRNSRRSARIHPDGRSDSERGARGRDGLSRFAREGTL